TVTPALTLVRFQHERYFKEHGIPLGNTNMLEPDGFLEFRVSPPIGVEQEPVGICLELDRGFEGRDVWQEKVEKYLAFASGVYQERYKLETLSIAVSCAGTNMPSLLKWTEELTKEKKELAGLFLFSRSDPVTTDPLTWGTSPLWQQPFQNTPMALIEKSQ